MLKRILMLSFIALAAIGLQACAKKLQPEESCNFVENSEQQRVSWGSNVPVVLYIHSSVPGPFFTAIQNAASEWNKSMGQELIKIGGWTNSTASPGRDGANIIYWLDTWEADRPHEQARTTVYWNNDQIFEADIRVNAKNFSFFWGSAPEVGRVDVESLLVHEFGHVMGLSHVSGTESVMLKSLASATLRRSPSKLDIKSMSCEY